MKVTGRSPEERKHGPTSLIKYQYVWGGCEDIRRIKGGEGVAGNKGPKPDDAGKLVWIWLL